MVRLIFGDASYFDLDRLWIPDDIFNFQLSGELERSEDETVTRFYSDELPKAAPVIFRCKRHFASTDALRNYVRYLDGLLGNIASVQYEGLSRTISTATLNWKFGTEGLDHLEASILLYPSADWAS